MPAPYINRELSWLEFNQRVLNEALRKDLPLLERVKFLAITASNLDEFFQVRIGGLMAMKCSGLKTTDASGLTPTQILSSLRQRIQKMMKDQDQLLQQELIPALAGHGIRILKDTTELSTPQSAQLADIFEDQIYPLLTPLAIMDGEPIPNIPALQVILACRLRDPDTHTTRHALIPIPDRLGRLVPVNQADGKYTAVLIEDVVAAHASKLFPGEKITASTTFRVTRNGDIAVQEEDAIDLAGEMEEILTARRFSDTARLEIQDSAAKDLSAMIRLVTATSTQELFRVEGPVGLSSLMDLAMLEDFDHLRAEDWPSQTSPAISPGSSMFETIASGDLMLFHPYESFEPILQLLEEAASDPNVIAIKQVLYRTAKKSRIIDALIKAAENGKHVTVLVELKARFDEARNLERADELQRAGAQIVYGVKNLKTHAKICMILRKESGHLRRYVHFGTGNYNESTAKLYTDISYLTCRPDFGTDASLFFNAVSGRSKLLRFQRLIPAPTLIKSTLIDLITGETERAKQGLPAKIIAKVNSLQDPDIIQALYKASRAGVDIKLNVRGICCLKPRDNRYSKYIKVVSIIDRFLEHARIFYFHQGGDSKVYISSADWMTRNLEKRVELMIPIEAPAHRRRLIHCLESYFKDNTQAYEILADGSSSRIPIQKGEKAFRSQEYFYKQARKAAKAREHERSMTFEPHVPQD